MARESARCALPRLEALAARVRRLPEPAAGALLGELRDAAGNSPETVRELRAVEARAVTPLAWQCARQQV